MDALEQRIHNLETTVQEQSESLKELESTGDRNVVQLQEEIRKHRNTQLEVIISFYSFNNRTNYFCNYTMSQIGFG